MQTTMRFRRSPRRQAGAAIAEMVIAIIIVMMVGFGAAQWALIYHAKIMLNHATLNGARAGAVRNADPEAISAAVARGLIPLYIAGPSVADADSALFDRIIPEMTGANGGPAVARLRILNPTREAFTDFGQPRPGGGLQIPNRHLAAHSADPGAASGINVQDANLLKIEVTYGYALNVPLVGRMMTVGMTLPFVGELITPRDGYSAFEVALLNDGRLPIVASATVRMQSPAFESGNIVSRGELVTPDNQP